MIQSPEIQARIANWRAKQAAGTMTPEDWQQAMADLRQARTGAQAARASKATVKKVVDTQALKDSLRSLAKK